MEMLTAAINQIAAVPLCDFACQFGKFNPVVQGAAIAAGAAIVGTLATLLITSVVTAVQLRHEQAEAKRDRAFQLKKDVLLGLLDGMNGMRAGITKLIDSSIPAAQKKFNDSTQLANRAHGTASIAIVEKFMTFIEECSVVFLRLLAERIDVDQAQRSFDRSADRLQQLSTTIQDQAKLRQTSSQAVSEALANQQLAFAEELLAEERREHVEFLKHSAALDAAQEKFQSNVITAQLDLYPLAQAVTALVRVDLGIDRPPDSAGYVAASAVRKARVLDRLKEFIPHVAEGGA